ncbi:ATP-dependent DNA helicase RecQ, partial [Conexibacter sp. JD483]|nr:ATP-dependent DNA helicase RecQ [Conexibacter sp. JD483]
MQRALSSLQTVFADPAAPGAAPALAELRARWRELGEQERTALTPLAKLAAERIRAAQPPSPPAEDDHLSYLDSLGGPADEHDDPGRFEPAAFAPPAAAPPPATAAAPGAEPTLFSAP